MGRVPSSFPQINGERRGGGDRRSRTNRTDRETWVRAGRYSVSYPEDTHAQNGGIRRRPRPTESTGFRADPGSGRGGRGARFLVLRLRFEGSLVAAEKGDDCVGLGGLPLRQGKGEIFPDSRLFSAPPGVALRRAGRPRYADKYLNVKGLTWTFRRPIERSRRFGSDLAWPLIWGLVRRDSGVWATVVARRECFLRQMLIGSPLPAGVGMWTPAVSSADITRLFTPPTI
jgi:hypothetical protein